MKLILLHYASSIDDAKHIKTRKKPSLANHAGDCVHCSRWEDVRPATIVAVAVRYVGVIFIVDIFAVIRTTLGECIAYR